MDVAAQQPAFLLPEQKAEPLMHPQGNPGGGVGGNPHPPGAQVEIRAHLQHLVFLPGQVAPGHQPRKLPENPRHRLPPGGVLVLGGAQPDNLRVQQLDDGVHIVVAVVILKQGTGQVYDLTGGVGVRVHHRSHPFLRRAGGLGPPGCRM